MLGAFRVTALGSLILLLESLSLSKPHRPAGPSERTRLELYFPLLLDCGGMDLVRIFLGMFASGTEKEKARILL